MNLNSKVEANEPAFSLVEVVLALGIVAFSLIALLGLLPAGLNAVKESKDERVAANLLAAVESDIRNVPAAETRSVVYGIPVWDEGGASSGLVHCDANGGIVAGQADADFALAWEIKRPPPAAPGEPLNVWIRVAWPGRNAAPTSWVETLVTLAGRNP